MTYFPAGLSPVLPANGVGAAAADTRKSAELAGGPWQ